MKYLVKKEPGPWARLTLLLELLQSSSHLIKTLASYPRFNTALRGPCADAQSCTSDRWSKRSQFRTKGNIEVPPKRCVDALGRRTGFDQALAEAVHQVATQLRRPIRDQLGKITFECVGQPLQRRQGRLPAALFHGRQVGLGDAATLSERGLGQAALQAQAFEVEGKVHDNNIST